MLWGDFWSKVQRCFRLWRASCFFLYGGTFCLKNWGVSPNIRGHIVSEAEMVWLDFLGTRPPYLFPFWESPFYYEAVCECPSSTCLCLKVTVQAGTVPIEVYTIQFRAHSHKLLNDELRQNKGQRRGEFLYRWFQVQLPLDLSRY